MTNLQRRAFRGWDPTPAAEVTEDEVRGLRRHARGYYEPTGALSRLELYNRDELTQVNYYGGDDDSVRAGHVDAYPGVRFTTVRAQEAPANHRWERTRRFTPDGRRAGVMVHLYDDSDREVMNLAYDAQGNRTAITKFCYEPSGEMSLLLEYDADGRNVGVFETDEGSSVRLDDVLPALSDPDFYANGFALPRPLSGASIPSDRDFD